MTIALLDVYARQSGGARQLTIVHFGAERQSYVHGARIVAFSLGHPGLGPRRVAPRLARPEWGGLRVSRNGVYKTLVRHGLNTRAKRLALIAGYRAPFALPREPAPEPHIETRGRMS